MKTFSEAKGDTAVFTFGRFNPPTTGHEKLVDALAKQQSKNAGSLMYVYPSHSQDAKKNPLPHARKVAYMKKMFRKYARNIITSKARNVFDIAVELHNKGHRAIVMVVGSDRVAEFDNLLNKYNGVDGKHGYYGFDDIKVVSAGERDPDAEGVEGMSASKMRAAAAQGDFDSFQMGLPRNFGDAKKLFDDIRKNMGVREQNWTDEEILRDAYIREEILNINEEVTTESGVQGKIVRKGTNYLVLETNDGLVKVWLHEVLGLIKYAPQAAKIVRNIDPAKVGSTLSIGTTAISKAKDYVKSKLGGKKKPTPQKAGPKGYTKKEDAPCWDTHKQVGMKKKNGKMVPNCVPKNEEDEKQPAKSDAQKDRDEFKKLQKDKKIAQLQYRQAKDAELVARLQQQEARAKQAVAGGKVQKLVTAHGLKYDGKVYKEIDMELKGIDNNTQMVTFNIIHPKEIFGKEVKIAFKALRRGPFMATDTSKINERKLTDTEKDKMKKYEKDISKKEFIDRYGKEEGEKIYYATITKMSKENRKFKTDKKLPNLKIPVSRKKGKMIGRVPSTHRDTDASKRSMLVAKSTEIKEWYKDPKTRELYKERYGLVEWLEKLNITYERMLSKLEEENCSCNYVHVISEAEYQGKSVKLNDPIRTSENPKKKFKVYVKNEKGTVVVVRFGDPNMGINRDDPNARKSFRARHNCSDPGPKWKARYWSCFQWRAGAKVDN